MKEAIEKRVQELKQRRAQLDGEMKNAQNFLNQATAEINGLSGAIIELESLLKSSEEAVEDKKE